MLMRQVTDADVARKYLQLKHNAELRGHDFNLKLTSVRNLLKATKCAFTGKEITYDNISIDRVDPTKGYIIGNVVMCDKEFNLMKGRLTPADVKAIMRVMKRKKML